MKARNPGYRASEVAKAARILPSTVRYWAGAWGGRLLRPDIEDKRLAGSRKLFSARNIVQARLAQVLLQAGFTRARVVRILARRWPRAGSADWFDPLHPLGQEYALMVIREPPPRGTAEAFMSGDDLKPEARRSWLEAMVSAAGPDFEVVRVDFPDGWRPQVPPLPHDAAQCGELKGARVIWLLNIKKMRDEIRARL